jgi:predicted nucleic-acid-binding protein
MDALDTNVLVRYLTRDDALQAAAAQCLVDAALDRGETLSVPVTVCVELDWVLRSRFSFDKPAFIELLATLLATTELAFESEAAPSALIPPAPS